MIKPLIFDSILSGRKIGICRLNNAADRSSLFKKQKEAYDLVYFCSGPTEFLHKYLDGSDFILAETKIIFKSPLRELDFKKMALKKSDFFKSSDEENVQTLGQQLCKTSRFYQDRHTQNFGKKIYKTWVANSINKKKADEIFVYRSSNGKPQGFLTSLHHKGVYEPVLVKVDDLQRGKGIGRLLMTKFFNFVQSQNRQADIMVHAQLGNVRAINFYRSLGLKLFSYVHVFHVYPHGFLEI